MTPDLLARLLAARPDDRFLRYDVSPRRIERVLTAGRSVAWTSTHPFRQVRWLTLVADDLEAGGALAAELAAEVSGSEAVISGVTAPPGTALPPPLVAPETEQWCWWWTEQEPAPRPGEGAAVVLAAADPRLPGLLAHSRSASAAPDDDRVRRWLGIVDGEELVAVAAHTEHQPGVPHLASVVTHPDHRGRGHAADLCARLTREALADGAPVVTLGMYSDNDLARRVYARLGYTVDKEFRSGYLPGQAPPEDPGAPGLEPADAGGTA
jgi:ribosomal protein S18 acetylase RimI-like enzyme